MFFNNILIPVDFSTNTEVAVRKALDIVVSRDVAIHLLHICKPSVSDVRFGKTGITEREIDAEIKLQEWKESIEEYLRGGRVFCWIISASSVQKTISKKASELKSDLIVIAKKSNHYILPALNTVSSSLAKQAGCAVLTVKPGSLNHPIKKIVVLITDADIEQKINAISALCKKYRPKIFLLTFSDLDSKAEKCYASAFLKIFHWINTNLRCAVEHAILHEPDRTKAVLRFAEKFNADILLLKPEIETKTGWMGQHISDFIPSASKVQVLTV